MLLLVDGLLGADTHKEGEHFLLELLFELSDVLQILCVQFVGVVFLNHAGGGCLLLVVLVLDNLLFLNLLLNTDFNTFSRTRRDSFLLLLLILDELLWLLRHIGHHLLIL